MLDQNQRIFAEIFRTSSPWNLRMFNRTSGLQDSLALGLQKLQVFRCGDVHQNFSLHNLQHLIRSTLFRGWDCSSELPVSESSEGFLANLQNLRTLTIF